MKILSLDPGVVSIGISLYEEGKISKTANLQLVEKGGTKAFKKKKGGIAHSLFLKSLLDWAQKSPEWKGEFLSCDVFLTETQSKKMFYSLGWGITSFVVLRNPRSKIFMFHPFTLSKAFKIGGLTRSQRKKKIRERVLKRFPELKEIEKDISQDELDSILNIDYYLQKKEKDKNQFECPSWKCASLTLSKPSS